MPGSQSDYLQFMAPGIVGMTLIFSSTMAGVSVLWDKQFGFMKEILVAPVPRIQIMLGKAIGGMTTSILQGLLLLVAAAAVGVRPPGVVELLQVLVFMVLISLSFVSIGLAFASRMEDPVAFPIVMNFLIMPLYFLSGALYQVQLAPGWLSFLSHLDPLDVRRGWHKGSDSRFIVCSIPDVVRFRRHRRVHSSDDSTRQLPLQENKGMKSGAGDGI